jgi:hypothetical protein
MARVRISTTVDESLLTEARRVRAGSTDAALIHQAHEPHHNRPPPPEIDAAYAAYDEHPFDEPDAWGDLASWSDAAGAT